MEESEKSNQLSEIIQCSKVVSKKIKACLKIIKQILSSYEDTNPKFSYAHVNVIINFLESISLYGREIKCDKKLREHIGSRICGARAFSYFRNVRNHIFHEKFYDLDIADFQTIFLKEFQSSKQLLTKISYYLEQVTKNMILLSEDKEPIDLDNFANNFEQDTETWGTLISTSVKENEENLLEIISTIIPMARATLSENYDQNESEEQFYHFTVKIFKLISFKHKKISRFYHNQKVIQEIQGMHGKFVHEFYKIGSSGEPNQYSGQKRLKLFEFYRKYALEFARIILAQHTSTILSKPEQDFNSELNKCLEKVNESLAIPDDFSSMILTDEKELEKCISDYLILFAPVDNEDARKLRQKRSLPELNDFDRLIIYDAFKEAKAKLTDHPEIRDTVFSKISKFGIEKIEFEKMAERFLDNEINVKDQTKKLVIR